MKRFLLFSLLVLLASSWGTSAGAAASSATAIAREGTVANFNSTCYVDLALPGTVSGSSISYSASGALKTLSFSGGTGELAGHESQVLAQGFTGTAVIPATQGPAVVNVSGSGGSSLMSGSFTANNVSLGSGFSAGNLDLASSSFNAQGTFSNWSSSLDSRDPQTQSVGYGGSYSIVDLDAATGHVDGSATGSIGAALKVQQVQQNAAPAAGPGAGLLLLGLLGACGTVVMGRRGAAAGNAG